MKATYRLFTLSILCVYLLTTGSQPGQGATSASQVPWPGITIRVSVSSNGEQGNYNSGSPSISADGRYVAFVSFATNLVPGDTNGDYDIYVHDRLTGETTRVSVSSSGEQGNSTSYNPSISADGCCVVFQSLATNLVPGDTNGAEEIFVHDRLTGETTRASVSSSGEQGNWGSWYPSISADGRYVAFSSYATNLVPGDTNGTYDIYMHDRLTGETTRVSVSRDGEQANSISSFPSISADGRYVAFESWASNLVPGNTNGAQDIFVHDRLTGETTLVSISSDGEQGNHSSESPSISADGRYVAFYSWATNLIPGDTNGTDDIFVHDRLTGDTTRVSVSSDGEQGNNYSWYPSISADGRYVAFWSEATNLVPEDTNGTDDTFVHDRLTGETTRISVSSDGEQGNDDSWGASISADGRYVAFSSFATNLVPGDTNETVDIFLRRLTDTFTISGRVTDSEGTPLPEVMITSSEETTATTDISGTYTLTHLITGTYVITPTLLGYSFAPPTRTVSLPPDAAGIDFTGIPLTYTIAGQVMDFGGLPIPGVVVSTTGGLSATTDISGTYAFTGVTAGEYTLAPTLGDHTFFPLTRTVFVPPDAPGQDFTSTLGIDFRPNPGGYAFANRDPGWGSYPRDAYDYQPADLVGTFGEQASCWMTAYSCLLKPTAHEWLTWVNQRLNNGHAYGMATTGLRFFAGLDDVGALSPGARAAHDLSLEEARQHIAYHQMVAWLDPLRSAIEGARMSTPAEALDDLSTALTGDQADLPVVFLMHGTRGHALAPYAIHEPISGTFYVHVYDGDHPDDEGRYLMIDTLANTWTYDPGDDLGVWHGEALSHTLGLVAVSAHDWTPDCLWCAGEDTGQVWLSNGGHLLITDAFGRRIGFVGDRLLEEIPGAHASPTLSGASSEIEPLYTLPLSQTYTILVDGRTAGEPITSMLGQVGPGFAAWADGLVITPTTQDKISIAPDGTVLGYHASEAQEVDLGLALDGAQTSYRFEILDADVGAGQVISLTASLSDTRLILDNSHNGEVVYGLLLHRYTVDGRDMFAHKPITFLASDTHIIDFGSWDGLGPLTLLIDHGSDGSIDETVVLENQMQWRYLPLMTRN